jgi:hypothetical protein
MISSFYGEELLVSRTTPKLQGHLLSAVRNCFFSIFVVTASIYRPSFRRSLYGRKNHISSFLYFVGKVLGSKRCRSADSFERVPSINADGASRTSDIPTVRTTLLLPQTVRSFEYRTTGYFVSSVRNIRQLQRKRFPVIL